MIAQEPLDGKGSLPLLSAIYGVEELAWERLQKWQQCIAEFKRRFDGRSPEYLVRAPGRAVIMGSHVDFQAGNSVAFAIPREILVAFSPRADNQLMLKDLRQDIFQDREFEVPAHSVCAPGNWLNYLNHINVIGEEWSNFAAGPVLRIQSEFDLNNARGFDALVSGNLVIAAGTSSSAALSVAFGKPFAACNQMSLGKADLARLAGEGEWYCGTRGGLGDPTALVMPKAGQWLFSKSKPKVVIDSLPSFDNAQIVACYTGQPARKAESVLKDLYNSRAAACQLGVLLLQRDYPQLEGMGDFVTGAITITEKQIYKLILSLPQRMSRSQSVAILADNRTFLEQLFASHREPEKGYRVRETCLFGVAESRRSIKAAEHCRKDDPEAFGKLMNISHNGDRIIELMEDRELPYDGTTPDFYLQKTIETANDDGTNYSLLEAEPGYYGNSCRNLDIMVQLALKQPGTYGAKLTGAGFGGHVVALVARNCIADFIENVGRNYQSETGIIPQLYSCSSVAGAGLFKLNSGGKLAEITS